MPGVTTLLSSIYKSSLVNLELIPCINAWRTCCPFRNISESSNKPLNHGLFQRLAPFVSGGLLRITGPLLSRQSLPHSVLRNLLEYRCRIHDSQGEALFVRHVISIRSAVLMSARVTSSSPRLL